MTGVRILFVTPYVPSPLRVRPYNFVRELSRRGHRVTVVTLCTPEEEGAAIALRAECERVETVPFHLGHALWNCVRHACADAPLQALCTCSSAMQRVLDRELRTACADGGGGARYDVVHVEFVRAALFGLRLQGLPRVYDAVDCISRLLESAVKLATSPIARCAAHLDLKRMRRFEGRLLGQFDRTLTTSDADRDALAELAEQAQQRCGYGSSVPSYPTARPAITVLPNGVDLQYFRPNETPREPATLVFVGRMSYHANVTAILRFVHEVMPAIWAQRPHTRLLIVGARPSRAVRQLPRQYGPRVVVTGYVPDTRDFLARATVSVNPLVYAVGVQNKILEALAMGTPVVATPPACRALRVTSETHLLIAEDATQFAHHVVRLIDNAALRKHLADNGRRYVEDHHDQRAVGAQLENIYYDTIADFSAQHGVTQTPLRSRG